MLFIGDDWAEAHHDVEIEDDSGRLLARRRLTVARETGDSATIRPFPGQEKLS